MIKPAYFFGKVGKCSRVEVWEESGCVYPRPMGNVTHELRAACDELNGSKKTFQEVFNYLKPLL